MKSVLVIALTFALGALLLAPGRSAGQHHAKEVLAIAGSGSFMSDPTPIPPPPPPPPPPLHVA